MRLWFTKSPTDSSAAGNVTVPAVSALAVISRAPPAAIFREVLAFVTGLEGPEHPSLLLADCNILLADLIIILIELLDESIVWADNGACPPDQDFSIMCIKAPSPHAESNTHSCTARDTLLTMH